MTRRTYWIYFALGIGVTLLVAHFQTTPGYMDADYYFATGTRLAAGDGFSEPFLWNYLDQPAGLPHPSHGYWMPLASILAALSIIFTKEFSFVGARLSFILVAGLVPPLTVWLSYLISARKDYALLAGWLAVLPGFYLAYMGTTDTFGLNMLFGGFWMALAALWTSPTPTPKKNINQHWLSLALGGVSGLMHLARADGILWLGMSILTLILRPKKTSDKPAIKLRGLYQGILLCLIGYFAIMVPWFIRNLIVFGAPLSPAGTRTLWLTDYDEIFTFPPDVLTPARWLSSGWQAIFRARWTALGQNLQSCLAVQGQIFLAPLILVGLWKLRTDLVVRLGALAWVMILFLMTLVFPFVGWRGGFFHSGAALQPLFWAAAPVGLEVVVGWGARVRRWQRSQALSFFRFGLVGLALLLTVLTASRRVLGDQPTQPIWNQSAEVYLQLDAALDEMGALPEDVVLVNNPPGYYATTGRSALAIPDGDMETALQPALLYGVRYMLLESNHPVGLNEHYLEPRDSPGWRYLGTVEGVRIYEIAQLR